MDTKQAKSLAPLVNNKEALDSLIFYAELRIEDNRKYLETAKSFEQVKEYQGAIREMKRFITLRDEVVERAKK